MPIMIRPATIFDANAICYLNTDEMGYMYPVEQTEEKLRTLLQSDKDRVFVAEVDGQVVGYVHANDYDLLYAQHMKNIMGIAVSSGYRGQGIGKALLFAIEQWAVECDASAIRLVSGAERQGAHAFYEACGYTGGKKQINFKKQLSK